MTKNMIVNLPKSINPRILQKFTVGSVEAPEDALLWDCFCPISPIERFLDGTKDILLGAKGAGKSAAFTLLKRKQLNFANENKLNQIVIPIDQQIEYSKLKALIVNYLKSDIEDEDTRYRFLWEIYILYRICVEVKSNPSLLDREDIRKAVDGFVALFSGEGPSTTLLQLLMSAKRTVGVKINSANPAFPVPDFYMSVEPSQNATQEQPSISSLEIDTVRRLINQSLRRHKTVIYVLVDNVDDFVAREEYQIQKLLLQGLLQTTKDYAAYPHLKVKLFLRTDLYEKLNFSQLGGVDKISPRTVRLVWTNADIRKFIAERILYNLSRQLGINPFQVDLGTRGILLDRRDRKDRKWWLSIISLVRKLMRISEGKDSRSVRTVNMTDEVSSSAITSIFPREALHIDASGQKKSIDIFDYLETHFCLASGETTPRIVLIYLDKVFSICTEYYAANPDKDSLLKDENGEFPLIPRELLMQAYTELQSDMIGIFKSSITNADWKKMLDIFLMNKGRKVSFSFGAIQKMIGVDSEDDMRDFLAYMSHLGVMKCRDKSVKLNQRHYEIPLLLQNSAKLFS